MNAQRNPRVFISRTTAGLKGLADEIAAILHNRGVEVIIQTEFLPDWRTVPQMLQQQLGQSDAVLALIGPAHGGEPDFEPARLHDQRTHGRKFSYTQWEYLVARDLKRPVFTFLLSGPGLIAPFAKESAELEQRQQRFITDFPLQHKELRYRYTDRQKLLDHIRAVEFEVTVFAGKPGNIPYASLGSLFKGREEFLDELRRHLTAEAPVVIQGKRAIHGMGGVGKTRAAIEYAWRHADDYNALLFIAADTPEALRRNLAALCGPLVLNLPEQDEKEQAVQVEAVLRWLRLHPGWLLIMDNVDDGDAAGEAKALLAELTSGHVLITSRISDWTGGVKSLDLDVLEERFAIEFLDERTLERRPQEVADPANVAKIVHLLDCLALALEQAGAHISAAAISYADYMALWESHRFAVLAWHDEEKMQYPRSLAITYETSVAQLSEDAKKLFRLLSWFAPDPIPRSLLGSRPQPADERRHLGEIERLHLARYLGDGKNFTIHRLNQEITRQQQADRKPPELIAALELVNGNYAGHPSDVRTWPVLLPLTPHALATATFGADCGVAEPCSHLLNQVAVLNYAQANHRAAEPLYRRALAMDEAAHGAAHPEVGIRLNNLAQVLQATNRFAEAEPLMRRALAIARTHTEEGRHPDVATRLNNLAQLLQDTDRLAEAEPMMREALAMEEAIYGDSHPEVARDLNNLARLLQITNRFAEAEPLMRRALAIFETNLGDSHPNVAAQLNNLGLLLQDTNRLAEAESAMRRALTIDEASYGDAHPAVACDLSNLATLLQDTNRLAEAEPLYRRALAMDEATFGGSHPEVAIRLNNLAQLLQATNRLAEAEPLYRRALAIAEASYGDRHSAVASYLTGLAQLLKATSRGLEAEPMMRRALAMDEESYGGSHPAVATSLNNLATLLLDTRRAAEAEPLYRRALAIDEASYGDAHPAVATRLNNLAQLLQAAGRCEEAEPMMRRALAIDEGTFGGRHPRTGIRLNNLALLLQSTNRLAEVEPLLRHALVIAEASYGESHPEVAVRLNNLAQLLQDTGCTAEAEPMMRRHVEILLKFTRDTGHRHPHLTAAMGNYGGLLTNIGDSKAQAVAKIQSLAMSFGVPI